MKKTFLLFLLFFTFVLNVNAQLLLQENFDYGATGNPDITIVAPDWIRHSGAAGPAYSPDGLTYAGYAGSGIGGAMWFTNGGSGVNDGDVHLTYDSLAATGDVFVSFLLNLESVRTTADYFAHVGQKTIGTFFLSRFFVQQSGTGWNAGLRKINSDPIVYDNTVLELNTTYLVVMKYSFNSAAVDDDLVQLYVYSSGVPAAEPGTPVASVGPIGAGIGTDPTNIGAFAIRQGTNTPTGKIDGIRIANSWNYAPVPVEFTSFTANVVKGNVQINWTTATETNNKGFEIERKAEGKNWTKIGTVIGKGTTVEPQAYSFTDNNVANGKYSYRLKQTDFDGTFAYSKTAEVNVNTPVVYELSQNYPNPFNPSTSISFAIPQAGNVSLKVYNMLGQEVKSLVNGFMEAGSHTIKFNADNLNSGLYFYKLESGNFSQVRKMTLLK